MNRSLKLVRPTTAIAAAVIAGALLASCSSSSDDNATKSDGSATTSTAAGEASASEDAPAVTYPAGSPEAAIAETAGNYLAAINTGKVSEVSAVTCKKVVDSIPPGTVDSPPTAQPIVLEKVENIVITGDSATADVTAALEGDTTIGPQTEAITFVNENGWKICE